jgi:hypothetical protein
LCSKDAYVPRESLTSTSRARHLSDATSKGIPMATGDMFALFRQMRKGPWTNNPNDPTYVNHWNTARQSAEEARHVYPGVARGPGLFGTKQMVNVVVTDQNVYVDTPQVERVGPVARGGGGSGPWRTLGTAVCSSSANVD